MHAGSFLNSSPPFQPPPNLNVVSYIQLDVVNSQLGHGETQIDRVVGEVVDPPLLPKRSSPRDRRPYEICPVPFAAQSNSQVLLHGIGGNRSVVSVDLLGRDGALRESTKRFVDKTFTCLAAAYG